MLSRPVPKLAVRGDDRDVMTVAYAVRHQLGDRVVTAAGSMSDPYAALLALVDPASRCAFEHHHNRRLQPAGLDGVDELPAQVRGGLATVPPPAVRARTHDIGRIHDKHRHMISGRD